MLKPMDSFEMIKFSRNNLKYQNVRSPPEHTANGNVHFATWYYCIRTCHSKQFLVGLMVLSDVALMYCICVYICVSHS